MDQFSGCVVNVIHSISCIIDYFLYSMTSVKSHCLCRSIIALKRYTCIISCLSHTRNRAKLGFVFQLLIFGQFTKHLIYQKNNSS